MTKSRPPVGGVGGSAGRVRRVTHLRVVASVSTIVCRTSWDRWRLRRKVRRWIHFARRTLGMHFSEVLPHLETVMSSGIATRDDLGRWYNE